MKKIFITGATGFLGTHLVRELVKTGQYDITCLRRTNSNVKNLPVEKINLVFGSIDDIESLQKAVPDNVDIIFHVAANTSLWSPKNKEQYAINVKGTQNIISVALDKKAKKFVHTSSIVVYGFHGTPVCETMVKRSQHSWINYFKTKFLAEEAVHEAIKKGLDAVIVNPCHIMGPYDYHNWITLYKLVYKDKLPAVPSGGGSFCHVKDVARALISAAEKGKTGENYLVGGQDATFEEIVSVINEVMKKKVQPKVLPDILLKLFSRITDFLSRFTRREPGLTPESAAIMSSKLYAKSDKAIEELGYCVTPLEEIVSETYEWIQDEDLMGESKK